MNIIFVEDHDLTRSNIEIILNGEPSISSVEAFPNSEEAIQGASWGTADILLTDINLPKMNGVELISWTVTNYPTITCMAHTVFDSQNTVFSAIQAGACGYLLKGATLRELVESILDIYNGGSPMSPNIARKVLRHLQSTSCAENILTPREQDVLRQLEQGHSYKEVADKLNISTHTVHSYIKNAYKKVEVTNRPELLKNAPTRVDLIPVSEAFRFYVT